MKHGQFGFKLQFFSVSKDVLTQTNRSTTLRPGLLVAWLEAPLVDLSPTSQIVICFVCWNGQIVSYESWIRKWNMKWNLNMDIFWFGESKLLWNMQTWDKDEQGRLTKDTSNQKWEVEKICWTWRRKMQKSSPPTWGAKKIRTPFSSHGPRLKKVRYSRAPEDGV